MKSKGYLAFVSCGKGKQKRGKSAGGRDVIQAGAHVGDGSFCGRI